MKFACIDFETANSSRGSACSIGAAVIQDGKFIMTAEKLIKPHVQCRYFDPMNIGIHGIHPRDVANSPEFDGIAPWLRGILCADIVVAHNAAFDMSVLRSVCDLYSMPYPEFQYFCTYKAASLLWRHLGNHKLNTLCDYIGHRFKHHNAEADAEAAGRVLLAMQEEAGADSPEALAKILGIRLGTMSAAQYTSCSGKRPGARK